MFIKSKFLCGLACLFLSIIVIGCDFSPNDNIDSIVDENEEIEEVVDTSRDISIDEIIDVGGLEPSLKQYFKYSSGNYTDEVAKASLITAFQGLSESFETIYNEIDDEDLTSYYYENNELTVDLDDYEFNDDRDTSYLLNKLDFFFTTGGDADIEDLLTDLNGVLSEDELNNNYGNYIKLQVSADVESHDYSVMSYDHYLIDIDLTLDMNENGEYDLYGNLYINVGEIISIVNMYYDIKIANNFKLENLSASLSYDELYYIFDNIDKLLDGDALEEETIGTIESSLDIDSEEEFFNFEIGDNDSLYNSKSYNFAETLEIISNEILANNFFSVPSSNTEEDIVLTSSERFIVGDDDSEYHDFNFTLDETKNINITLLSSTNVTMSLFKDGASLNNDYEKKCYIKYYDNSSLYTENKLEEGDYTIRVFSEGDSGCCDLFLNEYVYYNQTVSFNEGELTLITMPAHKIAKGTPLFVRYSFDSTNSNECFVHFKPKSNLLDYETWSFSRKSTSYFTYEAKDTNNDFMEKFYMSPNSFIDFSCSELTFIAFGFDDYWEEKTIDYEIETK